VNGAHPWLPTLRAREPLAGVRPTSLANRLPALASVNGSGAKRSRLMRGRVTTAHEDRERSQAVLVIDASSCQMLGGARSAP
jgi:hypothetical protein